MTSLYTNTKQPNIMREVFLIWVVQGSEDERRLVEHLFDRQDYNSHVRPVTNLSDKVTVGFEMALIMLINLVRKSCSINLKSRYIDIQ